jgi:hypothetical protein
LFEIFIASAVVGVGQYEDSFPSMGRTNFSRREYSPRRLVTKLFQIANDFSESKGDVSFDVFKEHNGWSAKPNSICDVPPQRPSVFFPPALSISAEWLTRVAAMEYIHFSTKLLEWECFKVRPDRSWSHLLRFHLRNQVCGGEGFDLHASDWLAIWENSSEPKVNSSVS